MKSRGGATARGGMFRTRPRAPLRARSRGLRARGLELAPPKLANWSDRKDAAQDIIVASVEAMSAGSARPYAGGLEAAIFSAAVPLPPEMMAPAWPMRLPGARSRRR